MRTNSVIKNTKYALLLQSITLIFGFLAPRFVIETYGSEVNGLTSTINQVLSALNLIQAGAVGAAIFELYRPLTNRNYDEISKVISTSRKFFLKAGVIFLLLTILITPLMATFLKTDISFTLVILSFLIMGIKASFDFFFTSKYRVIFAADQKGYILSLTSILEITIYYSTIFLLIYYNKHFLFMYVGLAIGSIIKIIILEVIYIKIYGSKIYKLKNNSNYKIKNRMYVLYNEISHNIVVSSVTIVVSLLYGLKAASVFAIYNIVLSVLTVTTSSIYNAFVPSFGNLIASENINKVNEIFNRFQFILFAFGTWLYSTAAFLIIPFVEIYTKGIHDVNYVDNFMAFFVILYGVTYTIRVPYNIMVSGYGFFNQTYIQPLIFSIISIILSVTLGLIKMPFIFIGPIVFFMANFIYQHYKIKKLLPEFNNSKSYERVLIMSILIIVSIFIYHKVDIFINSIMQWIFMAFGISIFNLVIIILIFMLVDLRSLIQAKESILKRFNKK